MFYKVILGNLLVLAVIPSSSSVAIIAATKLAWGGLSVITEIAGIYSSTDDFFREHGIKDLEFSRKEEELLRKIDSVTKSVDKIDNQVKNAVASSIESLKEDIPSQVRLELRLDTLLEMTSYINYADSQLKEYLYLIPNRTIERHTLENFAQTAVSHNSDSVLSKLNRIHDILHPGKDQHNLFHDGILMLLKNITQNENSLCHQSPYKTIFNLYNSLQVVQLKGYNIVQYSWNLLKLYGKGNFTGELHLLRERYFRRMTEQVESLKEALQSADSSYWNCDPKYHREGETYIQLTTLFQGILFEEIVLNKDKSCSKECSSYNRTQQYYTGRYNIGTCNGHVEDCRYLDSAMKVCTAEQNILDQKRTYNWIKYKNGTLLGNRTAPCNFLFPYIADWETILFKDCTYCFCICVEHGISHRYFSLREVVSTTSTNKVITGVRFVKIHRILHIQIQEGTLEMGGEIAEMSTSWQPVTNFTKDSVNGVDYAPLTVDRRTLFLDNLLVPPGHVVTGVKFVADVDKMLLKIRATPFNFTSGKLTGSLTEGSWIQQNCANRAETKLDSPGHPVEQYIPSKVVSKNCQSVKFRESDFEKDLSQSTVPFLDAQEVAPQPPVPLSGVGLYHKGGSGTGGFVGLKVFTYHYGYHASFANPLGTGAIN